MTRDWLIGQGVSPQWIDEIDVLLEELCEGTYGDYTLSDYLFDTAFQDAESDYTENYFYRVKYHVLGTDGNFIKLLVWVESD